MSISNEKGEIGEAAFVFASAKRGYWTGKMPQGCPYDYVLDRHDGKLLRIQVKFRSLESNGIVTIKLSQNTFTNRVSYNESNIDYIAVYVNELDKVYLSGNPLVKTFDFSAYEVSSAGVRSIVCNKT